MFQVLSVCMTASHRQGYILSCTYVVMIISTTVEPSGLLQMRTTSEFSLPMHIQMWQSQVENEHYSTLSGLVRLVISLECFIEITPDFLCPL